MSEDTVFEFTKLVLKWVSPLSILPFILRPRLELTLERSRCREVVSMHLGGGGVCDALYLRLWVDNFGFYSPAKGCLVFLNRILQNGNLLEGERSPLSWTDIDTFEAQEIQRGFKRGRYVDLCSTNQAYPHLCIHSQKGTKGYGLYRTSGTYTFEISAEATGLASSGFIQLQVEYNSAQWDALTVVYAEPNRKWFRCW